MRSDSGVRSTSAREVTISATYRPPPYSRQSLRKAELVMPAMGARTTGVSTVMGPSFRGGSSSLGAGGVAATVTCPLLQSRANRKPERGAGAPPGTGKSAAVCPPAPPGGGIAPRFDGGAPAAFLKRGCGQRPRIRDVVRLD